MLVEERPREQANNRITTIALGEMHNKSRSIIIIHPTEIGTLEMVNKTVRSILTDQIPTAISEAIHSTVVATAVEECGRIHQRHPVVEAVEEAAAEINLQYIFLYA